jgi:hypothetical protein
MLSYNGSAYYYIRAIALLISLIPLQCIKCQQSILDSAFTFRAGTVKTGNALNLISRQTGYNFTYDSRLINADRKTEMTFRHTRLRVVLDRILKNDSLVYSVIDQFIIISRELPPPLPAPDSAATEEVKEITGLIVD